MMQMLQNVSWSTTSLFTTMSEIYRHAVLTLFLSCYRRQTSSAVNCVSVYNLDSVSTTTRLGVAWLLWSWITVLRRMFGPSCWLFVFLLRTQDSYHSNKLHGNKKVVTGSVSIICALSYHLFVSVVLTFASIAYKETSSVRGRTFMNNTDIYVLKLNSYSCPITGLDRPTGFQEVEAPRFLDNRHMKMVRLSALRTGRFTQETYLVLISVRGCVD
jgi:hypothetical protein